MAVSNSSRGTSAAAESIARRSSAPDAASCRAISSASSAESGCATGSCCTGIPSLSACAGSDTGFAPIHAAARPLTGLSPRRCGFWRHAGRRSFGRGGLLIGLHQAERFAQLLVQTVTNIGVVAQELPRVLSSLADAVAFVAEPRAALLHQILRYP